MWRHCSKMAFRLRGRGPHPSSQRPFHPILARQFRRRRRINPKKTGRSSAKAMAMPSVEDLQNRLGYSFRDRGLLQLALTHPSVVHETPGSTPHNQRLEFLGDSVLGLVLTHELYAKFPGFGEG